MNSISFPNMFNNTSTNLDFDKNATLNNLKLLLASEKGSLFGDPYYGTNLKKLLFEQNGYILKDLIIDDVYLAILNYMPQVVVDRSNIDVVQQGTSLYLAINATNRLDYDTNLYEILLLSSEE